MAYGWLAVRDTNWVYPDEKLTPLCLNDLGQMPARTQGVFEFPVEHHKQRLAPHDLPCSAEIEVHIRLHDKKLFIEKSYVHEWYVHSMIIRYINLTTKYPACYAD